MGRAGHVHKKGQKTNVRRLAKKQRKRGRKIKGENGSEIKREERRFLKRHSMSSDEDVPAPSPSAAVVARLVARRASREAKSMREESGSDEE